MPKVSAGEYLSHHPIGDTLSGLTDTVLSAALRPGGKQIVTASDDGTARIWVVSIYNLPAEGARLIQRDPPPLTPEERKRYGLE